MSIKEFGENSWFLKRFSDYNGLRGAAQLRIYRLLQKIGLLDENTLYKTEDLIVSWILEECETGRNSFHPAHPSEYTLPLYNRKKAPTDRQGQTIEDMYPLFPIMSVKLASP